MDACVVLIVRGLTPDPEPETALALIKPRYRSAWEPEDISGNALEISTYFPLSDEPGESAEDAARNAAMQVRALPAWAYSAELRVYGEGDSPLHTLRL